MDAISFKTVSGLNSRYHRGYYQGSKHLGCLFVMCLSHHIKLFQSHVQGLGKSDILVVVWA